MADLASSYEEMTSASWLTSALREQHPDVEIDKVEISDVLHGVGTKVILDVQYASGGDALPRWLCAKAGWEPENSHILRAGVYAREARFYRDVRPGMAINAPACYYAGYDGASGQGIILLENLRTAGITFGTARRGFSTDEAAGFLEALAHLHAQYWNRAARALPWLHVGMALASATDDFYVSMLADNLAGSRADAIPSEMRDPARLLDASAALAALADPDRACLVHGDPHAGNLYLTADGKPGFYDFQTLSASHWATDVAYFLGAALDHEDRRRSVEDLLRHYLEHLAARVGDAPEWDEAWLAYRRHLVYGFFLWAITRPQVQPLDVITTFVDRLGNAAYDVQSYEALHV